MPRFYIDLHTGTEHVRDEEGFELPDVPAARRKLTRIMTTIAQDFSPDPERQDYAAAVRDEDGAVVLRARLSLSIETVD